MKNNYYIITLEVRHGEATATRQHFVADVNPEAAYYAALEIEASFIGEEPDHFEEGDGGFYSATWEFHYKLDRVQEVPAADAEILGKYLA